MYLVLCYFILKKFILQFEGSKCYNYFHLIFGPCDLWASWTYQGKSLRRSDLNNFGSCLNCWQWSRYVSGSLRFLLQYSASSSAISYAKVLVSIVNNGSRWNHIPWFLLGLATGRSFPKISRSFHLSHLFVVSCFKTFVFLVFVMRCLILSPSQIIL